MHQIAAGL